MNLPLRKFLLHYINFDMLHFYFHLSQVFLNNFYLVIFGCGRPLLLCGLFSSCSEWGVLSACRARASHCGTFSCAEHGLWVCQLPWLQLLGPGAQAQ